MNDTVVALIERMAQETWALATKHVIATAGQLDRVDHPVHRHVELHHDGAMALATRVAGWTDHDITKDIGIHFSVVDSLTVDAVAFASAHARSLGATGTLLIRAPFEVQLHGMRPLVAVDNRRIRQITATFRVLEGFERCPQPHCWVEAAFQMTVTSMPCAGWPANLPRTWTTDSAWARRRFQSEDQVNRPRSVVRFSVRPGS
ncbi:hypothetical protein ACQPZF_10810 [Actinosynnema sp. CS-041913]|uniref:hypothetical protein n=1 Tax=Actinosynnema sp. CS-041913 TaxID=3239917 RepID=UPI003D942F15